MSLQWAVFQACLDPTQGSEQAGSRPVLVVSRESIHRSLPVVTVVPLTSRKAGRRVFSTEVFLPAGVAGLPTDSLAMAQQIRTISKTRLGARYGELAPGALRKQVKRAISIYLDLD